MKQAEIVYFGTNGNPGHCPIGIDRVLSSDEYDFWCSIDNDSWIYRITEMPGYGRVWFKNQDTVYTYYAVPWSIDDKRMDSHTNLFWKGEHSEEKMLNLIKSNPFLSHQFKFDTK